MSPEVQNNNKNRQRLKRDIQASNDPDPTIHIEQLEHKISSSKALQQEKADKLLFDTELTAVYNRLNDHFLKNNMKLERIDVVKLPQIYIDQQKIARQRRKHRTTTTSTTTRRTTITTTEKVTEPPTTVDDFTEDDTATPEVYYLPKQAVTEFVGHRMKIVGEVIVDENNLVKPVSVIVDGKNIEAELDVRPIGQSQLAEKTDLQTHTIQHVSQGRKHKNKHGVRRPHHKFHFGVHDHSFKDESKIEALDVRPFIMKSRLGAYSKHHNWIEDMLENVGTKMSNFYHFFIPEKSEAKSSSNAKSAHVKKGAEESPHEYRKISYFKSRTVPPQLRGIFSSLDDKAKRHKDHWGNYVNKEEDREEGLVELVRTQNEFPEARNDNEFHFWQ